MFIDQARIVVQAGRGGDGCMSFRREKFVPRGGPNGGDGGRGGDVILVSDAGVNTLLQFRYRRHFKAERGRHGEGKQKDGRSGQDLIITLPVGTLVYLDPQRTDLLCDLDHPGARVVVVRGGRGGRGNAHFATPTHQAPRYTEEGRPGEEKILYLDLKLLADVGLIGLPNAGKSTLLSRISAARPKIADYPFTTLTPHLGVVELENFRSFVAADIPGLIEGAHRGSGLGDRFLKHVERTRVLVHLIDAATPGEASPVADLKAVNGELQLFNEELLNKPQLVVATKIDALSDGKRLEQLEAHCREQRLTLIPVSSVSGEGLPRLLGALERMVFGED